MLCDLHLHTTKSDGVLAPARLFDEVRARGLAFFSVTDHDCIDAYPVPEDLRDRVIAGMEVDSHHEGHSVHILTYGAQAGDSPLLRALASQRADRYRRMQAMVARLVAMGLDIRIEDVLTQASGATSLGRPHLARALVARGHVENTQQAFDRFISDDGQGYEPLSRLSSEDVIALAARSGCVTILAHPKRLASRALFDALLELGLDGIEVIHPTASPQDEHELRALARTRNLLVTGGTDFHAPVPQRPIGVEFAQADIDALQQRLRSKVPA